MVYSDTTAITTPTMSRPPRPPARGRRPPRPPAGGPPPRPPARGPPPAPPATVYSPLPATRAATARITNVKDGTAITALTSSLNLPLFSSASCSLTPTPYDHQVATVTFADDATLRLALDLPQSRRMIDGRSVTIKDDFKGLTLLSDGKEIE